VYLGSDPDTLTLADTVMGSPYATYDTAPLDLQLEQRYFWQVKEVNAVEVPDTWESDVASFTVGEFLVVDDFEAYTNDADSFGRVFQTWVDGAGYTVPVTVAGNGTDSFIGHDPQAGDIMEKTIVYGGTQSAPIYYGAAGKNVSEVDRAFDSPQDWTRAGIKTISLALYGDAANTGQLYLKINGTRVPYDMETVDLTKAAWQLWNLDLTAVSDLAQNVTTLTIGIEGGSGILYVDDIRLYAKDTQLITPWFAVAEEDAWVQEIAPNINFGAPDSAEADRLRWNSEDGPALNEGIRSRSFIKFEVLEQLPEKVELIVNRTNGGVGIEIRLAGNDWDESTITWNSQPDIGDVVIASGTPDDGLNTYDVSSAVTGPGTYTFVIMGVASSTENAGTFESRDAGGSHPPMLVFSKDS
jgi:hypothetical protein